MAATPSKITIPIKVEWESGEEPSAPFIFDERDQESLESAVFTALGAASMGWGKPARGRVFKSGWVKSIGDALMTEIVRSRVSNNKSVAERVAEMSQRYQDRINNQLEIINRLLDDLKTANDRIAELENRKAGE